MANGWTREQLTLAMELYCRIPFGRMHQGNPEVVRLAEAIGRTPGAVAMKLANLASLDPAERARGIRGLSGASVADREVFEKYWRDMEGLARDAEAAAAHLGFAVDMVFALDATGDSYTGGGAAATSPGKAMPQWRGPTEAAHVVMARRAQGLFRRAVIGSWEEACAVCELKVPALLTAGHIIPWHVDESRRADPCNGMAMCAIHDRAFDRGLIALDGEMRVLLSSRLQRDVPQAVCDVHRVALLEIAGRNVRTPRRFVPDADALAWHRENVFAA